MSSMMQKFEAALRARGETPVNYGVQTKWTRTYQGLRNQKGELCAPPFNAKPFFWFVGSAGSLRIGRTRSESRPVEARIKEALLAEGDAAIAATDARHKAMAAEGRAAMAKAGNTIK